MVSVTTDWLMPSWRPQLFVTRWAGLYLHWSVPVGKWRSDVSDCAVPNGLCMQALSVSMMLPLHHTQGRLLFMRQGPPSSKRADGDWGCLNNTAEPSVIKLEPRIQLLTVNVMTPRNIFYCSRLSILLCFFIFYIYIYIYIYIYSAMSRRWLN